MYSSTAVKSGGPSTFGPPVPESEGVRTPGLPQDHRHCPRHGAWSWNRDHITGLINWTNKLEENFGTFCGQIFAVTAVKHDICQPRLPPHSFAFIFLYLSLGRNTRCYCIIVALEQKTETYAVWTIRCCVSATTILCLMCITRSQLSGVENLGQRLFMPNKTWRKINEKWMWR